MKQKKGSAKKKNYMRVFWRLTLKLVLTLFLLSVAWVLLYRWVSPPATLHMIERRAEAGKADKKEPAIRYQFVELEEVSQQVPLALIAAEDQRFFDHFGFDFDAMKKAFEKNRKGKKIAGGSTISQQVAKNVFLWHGRSYFRKAVEAYFTVLIEVLWGKKRILEVYMNIAEMGDQVFGVEAAAQKYFGTSAKNLNRYQAARIAAVLPNPIKFSVSNPSGYVVRSQSRIMRNMRRLGGTTYLAPLNLDESKN
ncbi:MAG: monofunctional biosynthetic peptidoglycan transglycosylase [Hymenobacteraceae bacterium]|nr:monofunctional biosynthetic peptidoglycan transglycosylase [Hymenobacteraceae bacterium]MDX5397830.1 monofunctional biosynthetic peptidoglycan transglycosylase [Hymenobacteraceae bacterium]MDX5443972.1 monofunctional biosynthetic peptidoglycan transglycosylase [Hymenobacteraceae bacterium]MDX5513907.1 monofunctional biosynthetic peptidoglycan transglycosylase [Hymenobacteraceae bacterium]